MRSSSERRGGASPRRRKRSSGSGCRSRSPRHEHRRIRRRVRRRRGTVAGTGSPGGSPSQARRSGSLASERLTSGSAPPSRSQSQASGQDSADELPALETFRDFIRNLADDVQPDAAVQQYAAYTKAFAEERHRAAEAEVAEQCQANEAEAEERRLVAEQQVDVLETTKLFQDLYGPSSLLRAYEFRIGVSRLVAERFLKLLAQGKFDGRSLRAPMGTSSGRNGGTCTIEGDMQAPYFAVDPNVNTVLVRDVPMEVSMWELYNFLARDGMTAFACGAPAPGSLTRDVRAHFENDGTARAALAALEGRAGQVSVLAEPVPLLPARLVPTAMALPEQLHRDVELSARLVRHWNTAVGISADATEAVLNTPGDTEAKLDLQVIYLRHVHHLCFYSGLQCKDPWDLQSRCGAAALRTMPVGGTTPLPATAWVEEHARRLQSFLTAPFPRHMVRPSATLTADPEVLDKARQVSAVLELNAEQIGEGKFKCKQCGKFFKGVNFVVKHARRAHAEIISQVYDDVASKLARAAFLADPKRPVLPRTSACA